MKIGDKMLIDELILLCGYFSGESQINNYYNCTHPRQDETEIDESTGRTVGKCLRSSCPIAHCVDGFDLMRVFCVPAKDFRSKRE